MLKLKKKIFNCVELKNAIQKKILTKYKNLPAKKIREISEKKLRSSKGPVAKLWRVINLKNRPDDSSVYELNK